jgi:hypothetical protein
MHIGMGGFVHLAPRSRLLGGTDAKVKAFLFVALQAKISD